MSHRSNLISSSLLLFVNVTADKSSTIIPSALPIRPGSNVATISEHRRKEILAQLASERVGRRGFASEREVRVSEEAKAAATSLPSESTIANNPRTSAVQAALQSAASAAVSSALNKALQSLSKNESEPSRSTAPPLVSALRDLGSSSSSSAVIGSPSRSEKDKLVARLIAERRERMETDTRGISLSTLGNSSAGAEYIRLGSSSVLPPVPPVVAALQAQAAAAAAAAAAAMATASVSAQVVQNNLSASRIGPSSSLDSNGRSFRENNSPEITDSKPRLVPSPNETQKRSESSSYSSKEKPSIGDDRSFKRKSKEELRKEREAALYGECTFKPTIVSGKSSSSSSSSTIVVSSGGSGGEGALDARFDSLAQSKNKAWEERERQRKESEKEVLENECTFQPNVSSSGGTIVQNVNISRGRSSSPPPSRTKSPATTRSKTPVPIERAQFALTKINSLNKKRLFRFESRKPHHRLLHRRWGRPLNLALRFFGRDRLLGSTLKDPLVQSRQRLQRLGPSLRPSRRRKPCSQFYQQILPLLLLPLDLLLHR